MDQLKASPRLPTVIVPHHYALRYTRLDFEKFTFDGNVCIHAVAAETSSQECRIVLNTLELSLHKAVLVDEDKVQHESTEFRYDLRQQRCEMVFPTVKGWKKNAAYEIKIDFLGCLNDQMCGLYRSFYTGLDGKQHVMATTQFEATDARRAFPCFDEPALKATFELSVTIPAELTCISNTSPASVHTNFVAGAAIKTITFQKTPKMSTYLLALVVAQFDGISKSHRGILTTVYTVPGKANQAEFCLDVASRCLDLYQDLFEVQYPLTKSDLLAIPDFAAGAMENIGCVTYREAKILVQPGSTSETTKRGIARTVCHELSHMWFGGLVTMEFWTQLWLKEGLARFMEFVGIDSLFPEWNAWTEFVQSVYGLAMSLDSMKSSHPVEVEVVHPDEISEIFDSISYAKGASIIRMVSSVIGMEKFFEGCRRYLKRFAYSNAVTSDLWTALEESSGMPIVKFMAPWTLTMGFPIVTIKDDGIQVSRFLASGPDMKDTTKWPIPVTALVEGSTEVLGPWIIDGPEKDESDVVNAKIAEWFSEGKWFKLNVDQTGFFRVGYTREQWSRLSRVMDPDGPLSITDRLGLISDSFACGKAGYSSIVDSLVLVKGFGSHESSDYAVWQELSENLAGLASLLREETCFDLFQKYLLSIYSRQMSHYGFDPVPGEPARSGTLRATIIGMMCTAGDSSVLEESLRRFDACCDNITENPIHGDLQKVIFKGAVQKDEKRAYEALRKMYETSTFPEEQRNCLVAMGSIRDPMRHAQMLEYTLFSGKVRYQDIAFPLSTLATTTSAGGKATWAFFCENYRSIEEKFGSGPVWSSCVALSCRGLRTLEECAEVESFFADPTHKEGSASRRLNQTMELLRTLSARRSRDAVSVGDYLSTATE